MNNRIDKHLRDAGYSLTEPRRGVSQFLLDHGPATAAELAAGLTDRIDRASVFRTLKLFRELHIVHDVGLGPKRKVELTDQFSPHHHHLICRVCGGTVSFESRGVEQVVRQIATSHGYELEEHHLELSGLCPACQSLSI